MYIHSRHCACLSSAVLWKLHICIQLYVAIAQPEQKLVGVVAATVEAGSLQRKSVSSSSPTIKVNRSNLSSSFRLGCQLQVIICKCKSRYYPRLLSLHASTESPIEHVGSLRGGALCDTVTVASSLLSGKEWRPKCQGQATFR